MKQSILPFSRVFLGALLSLGAVQTAKASSGGISILDYTAAGDPPEYGSLRVNLLDADTNLPLAGANWGFAGDSRFLISGTRRSGLLPGYHPLSLVVPAGYALPPPYSIAIEGGKLLELTVRIARPLADGSSPYPPAPSPTAHLAVAYSSVNTATQASLRVNLRDAATGALVSGAKWKIQGSLTWRANGQQLDKQVPKSLTIVVQSPTGYAPHPNVASVTMAGKLLVLNINLRK